MKKSITSILALLALCAAPAMAAPSGINYQGALTDDQGNPITGTRTMSIKLYDAATAGTLLYSEDIGTVDVSDGVFSFEFGTGGTSNAEQSDTVAITDGTATSFQKVLSAAEVVAGSVSVTDGTYTWSQSGGSSNENDFGVAYSTSLRRVTVTYYNGAPAAGRTITATYRTPASGISGALAGDNQPWAEIAVDGVAQVPRQKVLTVPFAGVSARSLVAESLASPPFGILLQPYSAFPTAAPPYNGVAGGPFTWTMFSTRIYVPKGVKNLKLKLPIGWSSYYVWEVFTYTMSIRARIGSVVIGSATIQGQKGGTSEVMSCDIEKTIDPGALGVPAGFQDFVVEATLSNYPVPNGNYGRLVGGSSNPWIIIEP